MQSTLIIPTNFIYLFIYFKICIHEVYTGVRTKGHNIPYKVQPPYPTATPLKNYSMIAPCSRKCGSENQAANITNLKLYSLPQRIRNRGEMSNCVDNWLSGRLLVCLGRNSTDCPCQSKANRLVYSEWQAYWRWKTRICYRMPCKPKPPLRLWTQHFRDCVQRMRSLKTNLEICWDENHTPWIYADRRLSNKLQWTFLPEVETEELMPSSYQQFLYRNIPLSEKQENLLTLGLCMEQAN